MFSRVVYNVSALTSRPATCQRYLSSLSNNSFCSRRCETNDVKARGHRHLHCKQGLQFTVPLFRQATQGNIGLLRVPDQSAMQQYSSAGTTVKEPLTDATYETVCEETLESLTDYFEEILALDDTIPESDVSYSGGVLTVALGSEHGTYVINKQTPNKQIWLSSPVSGPKRYDFTTGRWVYKHDGICLHDLLTNELNTILKQQVDFPANCDHG